MRDVAGEPPGEWFDAAWWAREFGEIFATEDPVACNLRITRAHDRLSRALHAALGPESGANFHTWAVWGSKKAGVTIRQEDVPGLRPLAAGAGAGLGVPALALLPWSGACAAAVPGAAALLALAVWLIRRSLDGAAAEILVGNRTVLDDIGRATARFVAAARDDTLPKGERLGRFLATLRPGSTEAGGQDLLKPAFTHYARARDAMELPVKHQHMLYANLLAILHEHIRLDPHIRAAMPRPLRRWVTGRLLRFQIGDETLDVSRDVPPLGGRTAPPTLEPLDLPDLARFLTGPGGWDPTPDSPAGSRARDWTDIRQRLHYIAHLFRSRHLDPGVFADPFGDGEPARG